MEIAESCLVELALLLLHEFVEWLLSFVMVQSCALLAILGIIDYNNLLMAVLSVYEFLP